MAFIIYFDMEFNNNVLLYVFLKVIYIKINKITLFTLEAELFTKNCTKRWFG